MLRFLCDERQTLGGWARREFLRVAGLGLLGLAGRAAGGARPSARARSVLVVFTGGGVSQLDTFDPKPDAPLEIRGEFATIPTASVGTRLCEHLPRLARLTDRYAIVRSLSHDDTDHGSASYLALTGQFHQRRSSNPPPRPSDFPTLGAILKRVRPSSDFPYTAAYLNGPLLTPREAGPGQFGGFLGRANEPLVLGDCADPETTMPGLEPQRDLPAVRLDARRSLLRSLERQAADWRNRPELLERDQLHARAFAFLDSPRHRQAFDLTREPAALRRRYGPNRSGQALLLARRLIEIGVPWVTVFWNHMIRGQDMAPTPEDEFGWDTHNDIFPALKDHLLPRFDHSMSALLEDLRERGLLASTLVVCMGEFGRAPRVALEPGFAGQVPGRKHWAGAYSVLLAGAGIRGGMVHGATDRIAAYPTTPAQSPCDLAATMFHALGIDPAGHYHDLSDRPYTISPGRAMTELWA